MNIDHRKLYKLPWSKTDNAGGWVEVTDRCNLNCPGCYRHTLEGDRPVDEIKMEILELKKRLNCDRIGIAGGEPLLYPHLPEVIKFISDNGMKPLLLTNGENLSIDFIRELKKAGLVKFHFHVDSGMKRPGWTGKNEKELNNLRQYFADMVYEAGKIQCGYNITVFRSSLKYLPDILEWARKNFHKVNHLSLVALRAIPLVNNLDYYVDDRKIDASSFQHCNKDPDAISISTLEILEFIKKQYPDFTPATYLSGTTAPDTFKFLVGIHIASKKILYGYMGSKSVETVQTGYHWFKGRYFDFLKNPAAGKKIFILALIDKEIRKAFAKYLITVLRHPLEIFRKIYIQSISLQQPNEVIDGKANLCDGCLNMMLYKNILIHSCQLDEYRMFGDLIHPVIKKGLGGTNGI
jgi:uncharacterized Fe-S cluster-containing radical SAM superfamily protein